MLIFSNREGVMMKKFSLKKLVNQILVFGMAVGIGFMGNTTEAYARTYYSNTGPTFLSAPSGTYVLLKDSTTSIGFKARAGTDYSYSDVKNSKSERLPAMYSNWQFDLYWNKNGQWEYAPYKMFEEEKDNTEYSAGYDSMDDIGIIRIKQPVTEEYEGTYYVQIYNYQNGKLDDKYKRTVNSPQFNIKVVTLPEGKQKWNNLEWEYDGNTKTLTVSGKGAMPNSGYPWSDLISNYSRIGKSNLNLVERVIIRDGITNIGNNAFGNAQNLKEVMIGTDVETIGANAFNCSQVTILYNGGIKNQNIGSNAFKGLSNQALITHTNANRNFYNAVKGCGGRFQKAGDNGYIAIRNGTDWINYVIPVNGMGKYYIANDFAFNGRISIKKEVLKYDSNDNKYWVDTYTTYDNWDIRPCTYYIKELENKYNNWDETYINYVNFYGELVGDGHVISGVKYGLFNYNYGLIKDVVIECAEEQDTMLIVRESNGSSGTSRESKSTTYIGGIASTNRGTIEMVDITGTLSVSRNRYRSYRQSKTYYEEYVAYQLDGGGVAGNNTGTIQKAFVTATIRGNAGGIVYSNEGTIYGCAAEGTIDTEPYLHRDNYDRDGNTTINTESAGIAVSNSGTVEQCFGSANIFATCDYYKRPERSNGVPTPDVPASSLVCYNSGMIKNCSTGGFVTLRDSASCVGRHHGDALDTFPSITGDFAKYVLNNTGTIEGAIVGSGYRYTKGRNENQIYYNFMETSPSGVNRNVYTLQKEQFIPQYYAGIASVNRNTGEYVPAYHSGAITLEDFIGPNAKAIQSVDAYCDEKDRYHWNPAQLVAHNHASGHVGTALTKKDAQSGDPSKFPGLNKGDWIFSEGKYPRPKDSLKIYVENVVGTYTGTAVEGMDLDKSKIQFTVYYSDLSTYTFNGDSKDVRYPYGVFIANVGANNRVYFKYTDNHMTGTEWPEAGYSYFEVSAREREPVDIVGVTYNGTTITENTNYNTSDVRVKVLFDNGTTSTFLGSSSSVGLTTKKTEVGDLTCNGVVNSSDVALLKNYINSGQVTLTQEQRIQADVNKDGNITNDDLKALNELMSRKVPFNRTTVYVKYAGLDLYKDITINSVRRKVNGLIISSAPDYTRYVEGDDFLPKGMVLTVKYDNNESKTLSFVTGKETFDGLSLGNAEFPIKNMIRNQNRIPITYTENGSSETVWLNIQVKRVYLTSIVITQEPTITKYYAGESFDNRGMIVTAFYDEGIYTDGRDDNYSLKQEIPLNKLVFSGGSKLIDGTTHVLVKVDTIDDSNRAQKGFIKIPKADITSPSADSLTVGTHATIQYVDATMNKSITGTVVGNTPITVSYTEDNVTRTAIQPIFVDKKKLTKIDVFQPPHKQSYVVGDLFQTGGLILKAYYTDGTSEFVYEKTAATPDGYEVVNGDQPLPVVNEISVRYTKNGVSAIAKVPITVTNNTIESISASYTGPRVDLGQKFLPSFVLINVIYKNGEVESFYGDKTDGGRKLVSFYRKGTNDADTTIHNADYSNVTMTADGTYINQFTAAYAGMKADFEVVGIRTIPQIDFSESVAQGRRDAADWTETFRGVKVKAVYDYVNEYVQNGDSGLSTIAGKTQNGVSGTNQINPLLWFEREGDWVEPVTNFVIEYKTRTSGFLFPETGVNDDGSIKYDNKEIANPSYHYLPYLSKFRQDREALRNSAGDTYANAGWSDWVRNGDSSGTANGKRVAYDYTENNPDSKAKVRFIDAAKFRLNTLRGYTFKADENPMIKIYVNGNNTNPYIVTKDQEVSISGIQTMRMELDGQVYVRNNKGVEEKHNFKDVYRIGYKIGTANEPYDWTNGWVGVDGIPAECFEVKIQLSTAPIDDYSFATAPYIATQPEDASAVVGQKAVFMVKAVGQNLSYQWYKISSADAGDASKAVALAGETKYYYETPPVTSEMSGNFYYCVVRNGSGSATSAKAILYAVDKIPEITGNIEDTKVEDGQSYTFSIAATCMNPQDLKYQWEMTDENGNWIVVQPESENNKYTLTVDKTTHNRYIRCKVSNTRGYVYSNPARLSTIITPSVTITAAKTAAKLGEKILFTSYVTSYGGTPTYRWYVKNVDDGEYVLQGETDKTFEFSSATAGNYRVKCIVEDENGFSEDPGMINAGNDANYVSIICGSKPEIKGITYSVTKTGSIENDLGTVNTYTATFKTDTKADIFTGNNVTYSWYKNGQLVTGATTNQITLSNLQENTQVTVLCKVKDSFGYTFKSIQFIVKEIPSTTVK